MKYFFTHQAWFGISLLASLALFSSCDETKKDDPNPTDSLYKTGWQASDDPSTVPQSINLPDFNGSGANLPASVDLSPFLPPIGDQGQYGTCVAWAAAYNCKSAIEAIKFGLTSAQLQSPSSQMSAKYLFTALANDKKGENCNGTDFIPAMDVMLNQGVATKATVPYTNLGNCSQSSLNASWNADAAKHKIKYYRRIPPTVNDIKKALSEKIPVVLGAKLDDSFMSWNSESVYQFATSTAQVGIHSYHALCIVGYDNARGPRGAFKVVNSWGNQWGAGGFIWVDYTFMINGFGFASNPNTPNDKNFFVAVNDDQKPTVDPNPPAATGVDLAPWIDADYSDPSAGGPTFRKMEFNVYNIGTQPASASSKWGYAYIYYNAYNANDYGIVFYDNFDNTIGPYRTISDENLYPAEPPSPAYGGFTINCNIPADNDLASELFNDIGIVRTYPMPSSLNGEYYLVLAVDVTDKFTESEESNNLFYTTEQFPKFFSNGVGSRRNVFADHFKNALSKADAKSAKPNLYRTAVNPTHRNAYTPEEIIGFLKKEARSGRLAQQIAFARTNKSASKGTLKGIHAK